MLLDGKRGQVRGMITFAYDVRDFQLSGGAGWVGTERFDMMARPEQAGSQGPDDPAKMTDQQRKTMRDQMGERLRGGRQGMSINRGWLEGVAAPLEILSTILSNAMERPVVDKTGLTGKYHFVLEWTPDVGAGAGSQGFGDGIPSPAPALGGPTIFTALQEQLGLKLDSQEGPVQLIVIDRAEKPSEN